MGWVGMRNDIFLAAQYERIRECIRPKHETKVKASLADSSTTVSSLVVKRRLKASLFFNTRSYKNSHQLPEKYA